MDTVGGMIRQGPDGRRFRTGWREYEECSSQGQLHASGIVTRIGGGVLEARASYMVLMYLQQFFHLNTRGLKHSPSGHGI